ncbi:MAG: DUF924 family protein [Pseudaminobacter sp.]|nr:DUF924 family protein [Pseudaminobacter sp.]
MNEVDAKAIEVVKFWRDAGPDRWFFKDEAFDRNFHGRFLNEHLAAARRQCDHWSESPEGALALMILLDQFPRNCFRGTAHMFATDPLARLFAKRAIAAGHDLAAEPEIRVFFYLPLEHSENLADQQQSVELHTARAEPYLKYAIDHLDIIRRFGRFPHRNPALGRETTSEERAFLDSGGFAG